MLITFKSAADADILMFGEVGQAILVALNKDPRDRTGIVTVEQLPAALTRLRAAMDEDRQRVRPAVDEDDEDAPRGMAAPVSFFQRAAPLLQMLELARRDGVPVTWEAQG